MCWRCARDEKFQRDLTDLCDTFVRDMSQPDSDGTSPLLRKLISRANMVMHCQIEANAVGLGAVLQEDGELDDPSEPDDKKGYH